MKQIYYVPGMFSLIALFPLCYLFIQDKIGVRGEYAIETVWISPLEFKKDPFYSRPEIKRHLINISYHRITLNGDDMIDLQKLQLVEEEVKHFSKTPNFNNGIKIRFGSGTKYWTVIYALNLMEKLDQRRYVCVGDEIWILNDKKQKRPRN